MLTTIKCPKCHAIWPKESEAGERIEKSGECTKCGVEIGKRLSESSREKITALLARSHAEDEAKGYSTENDTRKMLEAGLTSDTGWHGLLIPNRPFMEYAILTGDELAHFVWARPLSEAEGRAVEAAATRARSIAFAAGEPDDMIARDVRVAVDAASPEGNRPAVLAMRMHPEAPTPRREDDTPGCCEEGDRAIAWTERQEAMIDGFRGGWVMIVSLRGGTRDDTAIVEVSHCAWCGKRLPE